MGWKWSWPFKGFILAKVSVWEPDLPESITFIANHRESLTKLIKEFEPHSVFYKLTFNQKLDSKQRHSEPTSHRMWVFHLGKGGYTLSFSSLKEQLERKIPHLFFSIYNEKSIGFTSEIIKFEVPKSYSFIGLDFPPFSWIPEAR